MKIPLVNVSVGGLDSYFKIFLYVVVGTLIFHAVILQKSNLKQKRYINISKQGSRPPTDMLTSGTFSKLNG